MTPRKNSLQLLYALNDSMAYQSKQKPTRFHVERKYADSRKSKSDVPASKIGTTVVQNMKKNRLLRFPVFFSLILLKETKLERADF